VAALVCEEGVAALVCEEGGAVAVAGYFLGEGEGKLYIWDGAAHTR